MSNQNKKALIIVALIAGYGILGLIVTQFIKSPILSVLLELIPTAIVVIIFLRSLKRNSNNQHITRQNMQNHQMNYVYYNQPPYNRTQTTSTADILLGVVKWTFISGAMGVVLLAALVNKTYLSDIIAYRGNFETVHAVIEDYESECVKMHEYDGPDDDVGTTYYETMYHCVYKLDSGKLVTSYDSSTSIPEIGKEVEIIYNSKTEVASTAASYDFYKTIRVFRIILDIVAVVLGLPAGILLLISFIKLIRNGTRHR